MIYFFQLIYGLGFISSKLDRFIFNQLLMRVCTITGECRSSGNCCRSIQLIHRDYPIVNVRDWQLFLKQFYQYKPFTPVIFNGKIQSFDCQNLSANNRCLDYENRPQMCRSYPNSYFLTHGKIHSDCGYKIQVNSVILSKLLPAIRNRINSFLT
ncbi:MAG: YkgJ family cysteine cluster protein [Candidatus Margulisiibacteriota bacterium]